MGTRVKQGLVGVVGVAIAMTMLGLGLWQMRAFESKEESSAQARAELAPVPLLENVNPDGTVGDVYGRQVEVTGEYLPGQEVLITAPDGSARVLTALQVPDGRVLPVVRGLAPTGDQPPAPPSSAALVTGVFLPSEPGTQTPLGSVRLPALAQRWPQHLLPGFVTLTADAAREQGLEPAAVTLPTGEGSWQNYGYALQWWVFAAFALFMTGRFVRAIGQHGTLGDIEDPVDPAPVALPAVRKQEPR